MLVVNQRIQIPEEEFQFTYSRSGGPGGQNVNKVASKATLHWDVTASPSLPEEVRARFLAQNHTRITTEGHLVLHSQRYRDQPRNTADCLEKVRELVAAAAVRPTVRKKTKPTKGSKMRRLNEKKQKSERKQQRGNIRGD